MTAHTMFHQPADFGELMSWIQNLDLSQLIGHFSVGYSFDALAFKVFTLEYPAYCVFDLVSLVGKSSYISCGYHGEE